MKKSTWLFWAVLLAILAGGAERSRYSPTYWRKLAGGIQYTSGNVDITSGTLSVSGTIGLATDTYAVIKTIIKTIDLDDDNSTDDFQFNDDDGTSDPQNVDLAIDLPPWAEILSCQIRCFEAIGAGSFQVKLGTSSGAANLLAQATVDATNESSGIAAGAGPVIGSTAAGTNVWIEGDPSGNWSDAGDAGRWAVIITYIDYGAAFTAKNP